MRLIIAKNGREILVPNNDYIFKLIFGDNRRKHLTADFLRGILNLPDEEYRITIIDPHLRPEAKNDKLAVVDVRLSTPAGKIINIEMQVAERDSFPERICLGKAKLITGQIKRGDEYDCIKKVICIAVMDYQMFGDEYCHHRFGLYDPKAGVYFGDVEEIDTLELPKLDNEPEGGLKSWMRFLGAKSEEELMLVAAENPVVKEAVDTLYELSEDEAIRWEYDRRELLRMDMVMMEKTGIRKGIQIGEQRGETKILDLLRGGKSPEEILRLYAEP
jgi:predicted transposase/invertase (TIGR01784 family)